MVEFYKGHEIQINTQEANGKWEYQVWIDKSSDVGTVLDTIPKQLYESEEAAIKAARDAARWRIDHPLVKPITTSKDGGWPTF